MCFLPLERLLSAFRICCSLVYLVKPVEVHGDRLKLHTDRMENLLFIEFYFFRGNPTLLKCSSPEVI